MKWHWLARIWAVPPHILYPILIPAMLLPGWWWGSFTGPYRWLGELQMERSGSYLTVWTGIFVYVVVLGPALYLLHRLSARWIDGRRDAVRSAEQRIERVAGFYEGHPAVTFGMMLTAAALFYAFFSLLTAVMAGPRTVVSLADLESGQLPSSRWLVIEGALQTDAIPRLEISKGDNDPVLYAPIVSSAWTPGKPVAIFVEVEDWERKYFDGAAGTLEGVISLSGLPGEVRSQIEAGGLVPAGYRVLDFNTNPENTRAVAVVMALFAALFAALTGAGYAWSRRRPR